MLPLALHCVAAETTNTFYVAEGETKTVDEIVAANGFTFKSGDWIRKTGKGQLNAVTTYKNVQLNLLIEEGVYFLPDSLGDVVHANGARIVIKNGAALNIEGVHTVQTADDKKQSYPLIGGSVDVCFEGDGTGADDNRGAICVGGAAQGYVLGGYDASVLTMTGDATIYTYGDFNCVIGGARTLDMNGHTLTVRGKTETSAFFPAPPLSKRIAPIEFMPLPETRTVRFCAATPRICSVAPL